MNKLMRIFFVVIHKGLAMPTELLKYNQLVMKEGGKHLQKGMNFGIQGSYSIVLMSVEKNARTQMKCLMTA